MDPAKPSHIEPADPFFHQRPDQPILDKVEIPADGIDCNKYARKLRPVLSKIDGVQDIAVDQENDRLVVTFDARKIHAPDIHDAILESGFKAA